MNIGKYLLETFASLPETPKLDSDTPWEDSVIDDYLEKFAYWVYAQGDSVVEHKLAIGEG